MPFARWTQASAGAPVHLHVGAPKTGTTYLQERLHRNAAVLARHGLFLPRARTWDRYGTDLHFRAALDLLGQDWGGPPGHARGAWPRLVRQVRRQPRAALVSCELLAPAPPEAVDRAMADFAGREVHVVYTARDLTRALPAAWQESLKQGRRMTFRRFLDQSRDGELWAMRSFDLPRVLQTWGAALPPEQIHLVVTPRPGADRNLLWERFCQALRLDPAAAPEAATGHNPSLGVPEAQVLRLLNRRLGDGSPTRDHRRDYLVRNVLAEQVLVHRDSPAVELPPGDRAWVGELAEEWIEWVKRSGIDVVGDLSELLPAASNSENWTDPDELLPRRALAAAIDALAAAVEEAATRKRPLAERVQRRLANRASRVPTRKTQSQ